MLNKNSFLILFLSMFLLIFSYFEVKAVVTRDIDNLPGVVIPTSNPDVTPIPTVLPVKTPTVPVAQDILQEKPVTYLTPTMVYIEMENMELPGEKKENDLSTVKIVIFLVGGIVLVGGLVFVYKSQMKG